MSRMAEEDCCQNRYWSITCSAMERHGEQNTVRSKTSSWCPPVFMKSRSLSASCSPGCVDCLNVGRDWTSINKLLEKPRSKAS